MYTDTIPAPIPPSIGWHIVETHYNEVVDVVLNNLPDDALGGEYRANVSRPSTDQHPFHMHGHQFWVSTGHLADT